MAMKKADYVAKGRADAVAKQPMAQFGAGTWQAAAYTQGYCDAVKDMQGQLAAPRKDETLVQAFKRGMAEGVRRVYRDTYRVSVATVARIKRKHELRALRVRPVKPQFGFRSLNITRGAAWGDID